MKKILLLFWILSGLFMGLSQTPEKMSYQAVIRNGSGQLLGNQGIAVKVSLLQGSPAGTLVYSERLTGNTNANGLINMEIGTGTILYLPFY